jgi:hypothetical protein
MVVAFNPYQGWDRIPNLNEQELMSKITATMYDANSQRNRSIPGAVLLVEAFAQGLSKKESVKVFRLWVSEKTSSLYCTFPGTVDGSDIKHDLSIAVMTLPNGNKANLGVASNMERFKLDYVLLALVGNMQHVYPPYSVDPTSIAPGTSFFRVILANSTLVNLPAGASVNNIYLTASDTYSRKLNGVNAYDVYLSICDLCYIYILAMGTNGLGVGGVFFGPNSPVLESAPRTIRMLGHSLGGGMAQIAENLLADSKYISDVVGPRVNTLFGMLYANPIYCPQVCAITFGCLASLVTDHREAKHLSLLASDGLGTDDAIGFLDAVGPVDYVIGPGRTIINVPAGAILANNAVNFGLSKKAAEVLFNNKVSQTLEVASSKIQKAIGISNPIPLSSAVLKGVISPLSTAARVFVEVTGIKPPKAVAAASATETAINKPAVIVFDIALALALHTLSNYIYATDRSSKYKDQLRQMIKSFPAALGGFLPPF